MSQPKATETHRIREFVDDDGIFAAAKRLRVHHTVLKRVLAGIYVRPSSVRKLRAALAGAANTEPSTAPIAASPATRA